MAVQADLLDATGATVGQEPLAAEIFGGEVRQALMWEEVKALRASKRRGTHDTKTRADVRGGGAKPLKQKGSGQARQGSRRAPNHVGGGTVFGPHPRDYSYRLPRSARRQALLSALAVRAKGGKVAIVDGLAMSVPKTKVLAGLLSKLPGKGALLVTAGEELIRRSGRNLAASKGLDVRGINVYDILRFEHLVFTRLGIEALAERLRGDKSAGEGPSQAA